MEGNFAKKNIDEFLELADQAGSCIIDARSESEFDHAHIPTALSLPLLNDNQRHEVGICYKENGQKAAIELGFKLVGPHFYEKIIQAKNIGENQKLLIYCWRGGLRSHIMSWLLSTAGFEVYLLEGGYKSYRKHVNDIFAQKRSYICLTGKTGTGKTEILELLSKQSCPTLNLEKLAHHKGSAFGGIGQKEQPQQEQFENEIAEVLRKIPIDHSVWFEDESRMIGKVRIPDSLFEHFIKCPSIEITMDRSLRLNRILNEYSQLDKSILIEKTNTLQKRMGPEQTRDAVAFLEKNDFSHWGDILLDYYDKSYDYFKNREQRVSVKNIIRLEDNIHDIIQTLLIFANNGEDRITAD